MRKGETAADENKETLLLCLFRYFRLFRFSL